MHNHGLHRLRLQITQIILLVMSYGLLVVSCNAQEESITITTYYPSPYGSYNELRAKKMGIGDTYYQGTVTIPSFPDTDLIVEGRVGIGTSSPQRKLVVADSVPVIGLKDTDDNKGWSIWDGGNYFGIHEYTASDWSSGADRLVIRDGGNVGIGTTGPDYKLDVNGDLNLRTSKLRVNGSLGSDGQVLTSTGSSVAWENPGGVRVIGACVDTGLGGFVETCMDAWGDAYCASYTCSHGAACSMCACTTGSKKTFHIDTCTGSGINPRTFYLCVVE